MEHPGIHILPRPECSCGDPDPGTALPAPHVPALFRSYLALGARVCGPPAIDRVFKTIDWLVALNVDQIDPATYRTFFR